MRRRQFIAGLGSAAAWPLVARAQRPPVPVIGLLSGGFPNPNARFVVAFRLGRGWLCRGAAKSRFTPHHREPQLPRRASGLERQWDAMVQTR